MDSEVLSQQIDFIKEIDKIKFIQRKTRLFNSDRHENDAEHSWHLAMMALVLSDHSNTEVDILKVIKMLLIHDIVEIDAGDTFLFDTQKNHSNTEEERKAAERIFGILPQKQAEVFIAIWEEFEAGETNEARFAKAIDHLEPVLQNASNQGGTWAEFDVNHATVVDKKQPIQKGSNTLWQYTTTLLEQCVVSGILKK